MWRTLQHYESETAGDVGLLRDSHPPKKIAGRFTEHSDFALPSRTGPRIRARRHVDRCNAFVLQQFADAENVVGIADRDATVQPVGAHDHAYPDGRFRRVMALRFRDQAAFRDAMLHQIVAPDASFTERRIRSRAASSNHDRCDAAVEDIESVIEPGSQHWRWTAGILGRTEDDDCIRRMDFLERRRVYHLNGSDSQKGDNRQHCQNQQTKPPARSRMLDGVFIGHSSVFILLWRS